MEELEYKEYKERLADFNPEKESERTAKRRFERQKNSIKTKYQGKKNPFKK